MRCSLLFSFLALFALEVPAQALRSLNPCETGYVEWSDEPLSTIVEASHTIILATAVEFVPDTSREGYEGYYLMASTGVELKRAELRQLKIYGQAPHTYPPQIYFNIESRHQEIAANHEQHNQVSLPGGIAGVTSLATHCPLSPKLLLGYRYLVMLGTESRLSFEPIHSGRSREDAWFRLVEEMVETQRN